MNELERITDTLYEAAFDKETVLLATVIGVLGSTYRGIGARMVIKRDGTIAGMISGGCLEADIAARAERIWNQPQPQIITYDSLAGEDVAWGLGLGCDGLVEVLVEPLSGTSLAEAAEWLMQAASREHCALATVIGTDWPSRFPLGRRLVVDGDLAVDQDEFAPIAEELLFDAGRVIETGHPARTAYAIGEATIDVVWEAITPPLRLAICGGGGDAFPMINAAASLGWNVAVVDHRPAFARAERFPAAQEVVLTPPGLASVILQGRPEDAFVIMSHNFEQDLEYLEAALESDAPYVGILGPKVRTDRLLGAIRASGVRVDDATRERLFAPVGLDVGADTPEEIALAVVAEILAARRGRSGDSLRTRHGRIHTPVAYDLAMF